MLILLLCGLLLAGCGRVPEQAPESAELAEQPASLVVLEMDEAPAAFVPEPDSLYVLFINVGYGDAALICYQGRAVLIDSGEDAAAPRVFAALNYMGVTALDAVYLSHTHSDHIGGLTAVANNLPVKQAYSASISKNKKNGENKIAELCKELGVPLTRLEAGDTAPLGEDAYFDILGPLVYNEDDDNDNSLIQRLSVHGRRLLFVGDMQFAEERTLLGAGVDLAVDILKVGNHGNPDATGEDFALAVSPAAAVISTSTAEDDDSANARVIWALKDAEVCVTEDYPIGVLLCVDASGALSIASPIGPKSNAALSLALDMQAQRVTITNDGAAEADLSGFLLYSERGSECFCFPAGTWLGSGASLTVSGTGGGGDYAFVNEDSPWNTKKGDAALLYDAGGNLLLRVASE